MHHLYGNAKTVKHGYAIFIAQNSGIDDRPWFAFTLRLISDRINVGRILSPPLLLVTRVAHPSNFNGKMRRCALARATAADLHRLRR